MPDVSASRVPHIVQTAQRGRSELSGVDAAIPEDTVARPNTVTQFVARICRVG